MFAKKCQHIQCGYEINDPRRRRRRCLSPSSVSFLHRRLTSQRSWPNHPNQPGQSILGSSSFVSWALSISPRARSDRHGTVAQGEPRRVVSSARQDRLPRICSARNYSEGTVGKNKFSQFIHLYIDCHALSRDRGPQLRHHTSQAQLSWCWKTGLRGSWSGGRSLKPAVFSSLTSERTSTWRLHVHVRAYNSGLASADDSAWIQTQLHLVPFRSKPCRRKVSTQ